MFFSNKKGFSLIELFFGLSILLILSVLSFHYFNKASKNNALEKDRQSLITILEEARSLSISSKNQSEYGVFVSSDRAILFRGNTYSPSDITNKEFLFNKNVFASDINLLDDAVFFHKLNGESSIAGTIEISLHDDLSATKIITILSSGVIQ